MKSPMNDEVYRRVRELTDRANELARSSDYKAAKETFWEAFDLVPDPKEDWEATTWILAASGDMWFMLGDYDKAQMAFQDAVQCPGGLGSAFIHLRLGQIAFEHGDKRRAGDELTRAYMANRRDAFKHENPKFFSFLEAILPPQKGQERL